MRRRAPLCGDVGVTAGAGLGALREQRDISFEGGLGPRAAAGEKYESDQNQGPNGPPPPAMQPGSFWPQ
jgi:hypothetical protein